jgi:hypothetical protein|tara:strand:+ start:55 stop:183 length:129 start_codon:yes stop_codon:yes gene_type:complete
MKEFLKKLLSIFQKEKPVIPVKERKTRADKGKTRKTKKKKVL